LITDKINQVIEALQKQFADKADTKKALKLLDRNLKNLYDLVMANNKGKGENEDDAMFTKKPFMGLSCASCEKDVINLHGQKVDYLPWGKLPFRDPSERISRVGQGFSKMLSMINTESLIKYDTKHQTNSDNMLQSADSFPDKSPYGGYRSSKGYSNNRMVSAQVRAPGRKSQMYTKASTKSKFTKSSIGINQVQSNSMRPQS